MSRLLTEAPYDGQGPALGWIPRGGGREWQSPLPHEIVDLPARTNRDAPVIGRSELQISASSERVCALWLPAATPNDAPLVQVAAMLDRQRGEILAHDPGVRTGGDAEDVHKFRVAVSRLRAVLRAASSDGWAICSAPSATWTCCSRAWRSA